MLKVLKSIIYGLFCKFFYRVKYINKENESNLSKCIICPNHSIWTDPLYIFPSTDNINIMAKAELFKNKLIGKIFYSVGMFPIHRGQKDGQSLLHAVNLIEKNEKAKLLIFPEGTRVKDIVHTKSKIGAIYIAIKANVPIVPVYITRKPKLFSRVYVIYGKPIYLDSSKHMDREYIKEKSDELLNVIYSLKDNR